MVKVQTKKDREKFPVFFILIKKQSHSNVSSNATALGGTDVIQNDAQTDAKQVKSIRELLFLGAYVFFGNNNYFIY